MGKNSNLSQLKESPTPSEQPVLDSAPRCLARVPRVLAFTSARNQRCIEFPRDYLAIISIANRAMADYTRTLRKVRTIIGGCFRGGGLQLGQWLLIARRDAAASG